jgi:hypothetical protein
MRKIKKENGALFIVKTGKVVCCPFALTAETNPACIEKCAAYYEHTTGDRIFAYCGMAPNHITIGEFVEAECEVEGLCYRPYIDIRVAEDEKCEGKEDIA